MYKVVIVEDEMLVRIGLKNSVDWAKFNMEVVADLPDGQAAWEHYQREKPDVVITDIRMPKMDGMQLIEQIRNQDKSTRIVVLSCLEEFELARKAMGLGVSNYILKLTMTEPEIEGVLSALKEELQQQEGRPAAAEGTPLASRDLDLVKEKMLKDFLFYGILSPAEFQSFVSRSGLKLSPARLVACLMEVDHIQQVKRKFKDEHGHLIKMTMLNILSEITSVHKRGEAFYIDETRYLLLLHYDDVHSEQAIAQDTTAILHHIQEVMQTYFSGSVSFGMSGVQSGYKALPRMYADAERALARKFWTGSGHIFTGEEKGEWTALRVQLEELRACTPIKAMLLPAKQKEFERYIEHLASAIGDNRRTVETVVYQFVQWVSTQAYEDNQSEKALLLNITEQLEECDSLPDMLKQVQTFLSELAEEAHHRLHMSDEVSKALQYMKRHYHENISLQTVADHVNLSFSYLSNLFKKELQITFVDYLNRYRIERAKELLISTQMKSYDIAVQVGFSPEYTYFSKVFKKMTGLNPNEFRRQWMLGTTGDE